MLVTGYAMVERGEPLEPFEYEARPAPGEVLVEVHGCGVCHTDLGFLDDGVPTRHALPLILGHEISGVVVEAGAGAEDLVGQAVVVPAVIPCGACDACARGRGAICRAQVFPGNDVHGGFASHTVVPARGLAAVGDLRGEPLARLAVVADAVSTAYQAVLRSGVGPGHLAVFVGAGGVGGFGIQVAAAFGARVVAIDVDPDRLALVREHGAEWTLDARDRTPRQLRDAVRSLAKGNGLPSSEWRVFETSGTAPGQETAFGLLTFGGYLGVVGFHPGEVPLRLSNLMAFEAKAEGHWGCLPEHFGRVLQMIDSGALTLDPFIELFALERVDEVLARLRRKELGRRPVLVPPRSS